MASGPDCSEASEFCMWATGYGALPRGPHSTNRRGLLLLFAPENEPASPLVSGIIDYNMPLTSTYLKQMKLRVMNSQEQVSTLSTLHPHLEAGVLTCLDAAGPFQTMRPPLSKYPGNQRGPFLAFWASRVERQRKECSFLRGGLLDTGNSGDPGAQTLQNFPHGVRALPTLTPLP